MFALSYSNIIHCHPFSENTQLVSPGLHMFGPITPMRYLIARKYERPNDQAGVRIVGMGWQDVGEGGRK